MNLKITNFIKPVSLLPCMIGIYAQAQNVNIPDANFKNLLLQNSNINTDGNAEISVAEAQSYTGTIAAYEQNISDLTGIEAFKHITRLFCEGNNLTSINLSQNKDLLELWCFDNNLTSVDLSQNTKLRKLFIENNNLTSLDVSANIALVELYCNNNQLSSIDISSNKILKKLYCGDNPLHTLDVSQNIALQYLSCPNNQLSTIDLSNNGNLEYLYCQKNQFTYLDLSANNDLIRLECANNQIKRLDLSDKIWWTYIDCSNNALTVLNVANGHNQSYHKLIATGNPNLSCIQHDAGFNPEEAQYPDVAGVMVKYWVKDDTAIWSTESCFMSTDEVNVNKNRVEVYPNPATHFVNVKWKNNDVDKIEIFDMNGKLVLSNQVKRNDIVLNIGHLEAGVYLIKVGELTHKLIVK